MPANDLSVPALYGVRRLHSGRLSAGDAGRSELPRHVRGSQGGSHAGRAADARSGTGALMHVPDELAIVSTQVATVARSSCRRKLVNPALLAALPKSVDTSPIESLIDQDRYEEAG